MFDGISIFVIQSNQIVHRNAINQHPSTSISSKNLVHFQSKGEYQLVCLQCVGDVRGVGGWAAGKEHRQYFSWNMSFDCYATSVMVMMMMMVMVMVMMMVICHVIPHVNNDLWNGEHLTL